MEVSGAKRLFREISLYQVADSFREEFSLEVVF